MHQSNKFSKPGAWLTINGRRTFFTLPELIELHYEVGKIIESTREQQRRSMLEKTLQPLPFDMGKE